MTVLPVVVTVVGNLLFNFFGNWVTMAGRYEAHLGNAAEDEVVYCCKEVFEVG